MDERTRIGQSTDDQLLHLIEKQILAKEGSPDWYDIQQKINQIIAERFLHYVNR